jgi:hypothetical protein
MVYQRYSTYKNVVKLFLSQEMKQFIDRKTTKKPQKSENKKISSIELLDKKVELSEE